MGYFRLALALTIMAAHAHAIPIVWAQGSVLLFYLLAGYLGAASMSGPYQGRPWAFLINRWLRVWPCYAVVFVISLGWLLWRGVPPVGLALGMPSWSVVAVHFAMLPTPVNLLIVPTGWMLPWLFMGWILIALVPHVSYAMLTIGLPWFVVAQDYYGAAMSLWTMAIGVVAYQGRVILPRDGHWGAIAGTISFPLFLVHVLVLGELSFWIPLGWPLFFAALPPTLVLSWLLVMSVDQPVQGFRSSLRSKSNNSLP